MHLRHARALRRVKDNKRVGVQVDAKKEEESVIANRCSTQCNAMHLAGRKLIFYFLVLWQKANEAIVQP